VATDPGAAAKKVKKTPPGKNKAAAVRPRSKNKTHS